MKRAISLVALMCAAGTATAHHGAQSQFDQSKTIEVSGVVTKIRFVNPHSYVYFDVTNEDGEVVEWRCEMRAATVLKRSGWSADMFVSGSRINIEGVPARREPHGCYVNRFSLDEGETIERYQVFEGADKPVDDDHRPARLADGTPNLSGDWAAPQRLPTEQAVRAINPERRNRQGRSRYQATQAGIDAAVGHEREDNPRFQCEATNILFDWTFDQHINRIDQTDDEITMTYGFMDIVRTIHLDVDAHPRDIEPSRAGHSIGKWDGDTLVVDTIGFLPGFLEGRSGVKHSDQMHVVERFTINPEDNSLTRTYTAEDPLYLAAPHSGEDKIFLSQTPFDPYNCEELTDEIVPGI